MKTCVECGSAVSSDAAACPNCGKTNPTNKTGCLAKGCLVAIGVWVISAVLAGVGGRGQSAPTPAASSVSASSAQTSEKSAQANSLGAGGAASAKLEVGGTYQLNRARYPGKVVVCESEDAMSRYTDLTARGSYTAAAAMILPVQTAADLKKLKSSNACTAISSYSQATILSLGIDSHHADFLAFGLHPMWGYYLYFGGRVR